MKKTDKMLRIALLLGQDIGYCRNVLQGILSYRSAAHTWIHRDSSPDIRVIPSLTQWRPDGIIAHIFDPAVGKALKSFDCPIVNTTDTIAGCDLPCIDVDNLGIGEMAAKYLLQKGFKNFGYFGSSWANFSLQREQGFRQELKRHGGCTISTLNSEFLPRPSYKRIWETVDKNVESWLSSLPKPCAILASNDIPARYLTEICSELSIRVPDQIAILGVDNDDAECHMSFPTLSSIETPEYQIGYRAAEILDQLIQGNPPEKLRTKLPPSRIIERDSTSIETHSDPTIQRLKTLISQNATDNPSVGELAMECGVSRRLLEKKVSTILNTTVLRLVQEQQVRFAKTLLLDTQMPIGEIAEATGFGSQRRLNDVFKKRTGYSPSEFKKEHQQNS